MKSISGLLKLFLLAVLGKRYGLGDMYAVTAANCAGLWDRLRAARDKGEEITFCIDMQETFDTEAARSVCKFLHYAMARYEKSLPTKVYYYGLIRALAESGKRPREKNGKVGITPRLAASYAWEQHLRLILRRLSAPLVRLAAGLMVLHYAPRPLISPKEIYITGWYGTETTGDKAILGGIIRQARRICPSLEKVTVSSIVPYFTRETMEQLAVGDTPCDVIGRGLRENRKAIRRADWVVMGGGPLMELYEVYTVLLAMMRARLRGRRAVIWGCGIGPLHSRGMKRAVRLMLLLADIVVLRDAFSSTVYPEVVKGITFYPCIDPAVAYLLDIRDTLPPPPTSKEKTVLFCIRELPLQYCTSAEEHKRIKAQFLEETGKTVTGLLRDTGVRVRFFPMNTFVIGQDDREYYHALQEVLPDDPGIEYLREDFTLHEAAAQFLGVDAAVAMRFHSVVFATTLEVPTLAVDYDMLGGKIRGFMERLCLMDRHIPIAEATAARMIPLIRDFLAGDEESARVKPVLAKCAKGMAEVLANAMRDGRKQPCG